MAHIRSVVAALSVAAIGLPCAARASISVSPTTVTASGSYTVSWTDTSGGVWRAYLRESVNGGTWSKTTVTGTYSKTYTGKPVGSYAYKVQIYLYDREIGVEEFDHETNVATVQVVPVGAPGMPGAITGPPNPSTSSFTLSWGAASGAVTRYDLRENGVVVYSGSALTATLTGKQDKTTYRYAVVACNTYGCGPGTADFTVSVELSLTETVADAPPPVDPIVPAQEWVGTIPGDASTDGGSASYGIAIEIPPGRAGMQPDVSLRYGSRQGNGVVGVGWSLGASSTVYRCPRTLRQDGANAPVTYDIHDRLCWSGQRLVATEGTYGSAGSKYRTEVDQFARITQGSGGMDSWSAAFTVEHKSGRVSVYKPLTQVSSPSHPPDTWYLAEEYDPQGNCVAYTYSRFAARASDEEWVLASVGYTGAHNFATGGCWLPSDARRVDFDYTADREDRRTTYTYGVAHMLTARLSAIRTTVGSQPVRRYEVAYKTSAATRRSLLASVTLCAGAVCGTERLPPTTFAYEEHGADFVLARPVDPTSTTIGDHMIATGSDPVGPPTWRVSLVGDYDGDGSRDWGYSSKSLGRAILRLSKIAAPVEENRNTEIYPGFLGAELGFVDADRAAITPDVNFDGRSDLLGALVGDAIGDTENSRVLAIASYMHDQWTSIKTTLRLPDSPPGSIQNATDYDGDGRMDVKVTFHDSATNTSKTYYHRGLDPDRFYGPQWDPATIEEPSPGQYQSKNLVKDVNGGGASDTVFDTTDGSTPKVNFQGYGDRWLGCAGNLGCAINNLGGPGEPFALHQARRWIDVNGDGLPDIFEPGTLWVNRGGPPDSVSMFEKVTVSGESVPIEYDRDHFTMVMDVDADGADELMVPVDRVPGYQWCYDRWDPVEPRSWCGAQFDTDPHAVRSADKSVFRWDAFKFVEMPDGTYSLTRIPTTLWAPINARAAPDDWDGDGMPDVGFGLWDDATGGSYPDASLSLVPTSPSIGRQRRI